MVVLVAVVVLPVVAAVVVAVEVKLLPYWREVSGVMIAKPVNEGKGYTIIIHSISSRR